MGSGCKHDVCWYYLVFFHSFYNALKLTYFDILSSYFTTLGCYKWLNHDFVRFYLSGSESAGFRCSIMFCDIEMLKFTTTCYFSGKVPNLVHWPAFQNICPPQSWHFSLFPSCCVCPLCARCLSPMRSRLWTWRVWHPRRQAAQSSATPKKSSIKWPHRIKSPKNHNRCWTGHFVEALHPIPPDPFEQRMPL